MKQTRLKTVWFFGTISAILCGAAIYNKMEAVAVVLAGVIGGIIAKYNHDETKRPSKK